MRSPRYRRSVARRVSDALALVPARRHPGRGLSLLPALIALSSLVTLAGEVDAVPGKRASQVTGGPVIRVSIGDARVVEGNAGTTNLVFPWAALDPVCKPITVTYQTQPGTAIAGTDYVTTGGNATLNPLPPAFELKWGTTGSAPGQFINPHGVAVAPNGNVFVVDVGNFRIQKFNASSGFLQEWGSAGLANGQFMTPAGIAVDESGDTVYVADQGSHRIQKFTVNSTFLKVWGRNFGDGTSGTGNGEFTKPYGVAVDDSGYVYVAEFGSGPNGHRIQKFNSDGGFVRKWGSFGTTDSLMQNPSGVAVDASGNVFVSDFSNDRILKFDRNGLFLATWGSSGSGPGDFNRPHDVEVDADGCVYVADPLNHRIQKFDGDGNFLVQWGVLGDDDGEFNLTRGVAVGPGSYVYVTDIVDASAPAADQGGDRVQKFRPVLPSGSITVQVNGDVAHEPNERFRLELSNPVNATLEKSVGHGLIANDDTVGITIADASKREFDVDVGPVTFNVFFTGPNERPVSVDYQTQDGSALLADNDYNAASGTLQIPVATPQFRLLWGSDGQGDDQFLGPTHMAIDGSGNVFVADFSNHRIQKFASDGTFLHKWGKNNGAGGAGSAGTGDGEFTNPAAVAVDAFGNVYVADNNHSVQKFDGNGSFLFRWGSGPGSGTNQFNQPTGIAVDANGNVYVADRNNNRVQKFDSNGNYLSTITSAFNAPFAVAVDLARNLFVTEIGANRVQKFDSSGTPQGSWSGFDLPTSIATDASGNVYVGNFNSNSIQKFTNTGVLLDIWPSHSKFQTPRGIAVNGGDSVYVSDFNGRNILMFSPDTPFRTIDVNVNGDVRIEPNENLGLQLSPPVNATLVRDRAWGVILNDDAEVAIGNARVGEGNSGTASLDFPLAAKGIGQSITVHYQTLDSTATVADADYVAASGDITINPKPPAFSLAWGVSSRGVAVDADGYVYALEGNNVNKYDANGVPITAWPSPVGFMSGWSLAVDGNSSVYVADIDNHRILKFNSTGTFIRQWGTFGTADGQFNRAAAVAVSGSGNVYVLDLDNDRVQKFDANGNFLTKWGSSGSTDEEFDFALGIAVGPDNHVYVADRNARVQKFDENGNFVLTWGGSGTFNQPTGVAVDASGAVYVADTGNHRIRVFDGNGVFLTEWGSNGSDPGEFSFPWAPAVSISGDVYVTEDGANQRIQKFRPVNPFGLITVAVNGDTKVEPSEILKVQLSNPVNASVVRDLATGLILNDDMELRIADDRVVEGNAGPVNLEFRVSFRGPFCRQVSFDYQTADGTATTGDNDYGFTSSAAGFVPPAPVFEQQWTSGFDGPVGVALDGRGSVYVSDYNNHRIRKYDANGNLLLQWGSFGTDTGQFNLPNGLAVDGFGNVYVAEESGHRVQKFNSNGVFLAKWGSQGSTLGKFNLPIGLAIDPSGFVYVTDHLNNRIQKFDLDGNFVLAWGSPGASDSSFNAPYGVAVDGDNHVYVVQLGGNRVQKFDANGNFLLEWGDPGDFNAPTHATVDQCGNVYVAETAGSRVQVFDENGGLLTRWGSPGTGPEEFGGAYGVAVDDTGHVYVADYGNDRIQKFKPNTTDFPITVPVNGDTKYEPNETMKLALSNIVNATAAKDTAYGCIVNDDPVEASIADASGLEGNAGTSLLDFLVTLSGPISDSVQVHYQTADGSALVADDDYEAASGDLKFSPAPPAFEMKWGSTGTGDQQFLLPTSLALDGRSQVYVVDQDRGLVRKFDANGTFLASWGGFGAANGQFGSPAGIAVDGSGYVYVADQSSHRVNKFDANGTFVTRWGSLGTGDGQFSNPTGVAVDALGNVYVVDAANHRVQKFDSNGTFILKWGSSGSGNQNFNVPVGVAVSGDGYVYVVDHGNHRVVKFDAVGNYLAQWGQNGTDDGEFDFPYHPGVDAIGNVYVADQNNHRIQKFDSDGAFIAKWGTPGSADGQLAYPLAVAVDCIGKVYVSDSGNDRIQRFAPVTPSDTIPVTINGDTNLEPDQTFTLTLSAPVNATLADSVATGTILNDDAPSNPNLACNPGFEPPQNQTGWARYGPAQLSLVQPGRTGLNALQVKGTDDEKFGIDDSPNCINPTELNRIYQVSAYVKGVGSARGYVTIQVREYVGSSSKGSATSIKVRLNSTSWQQVTVEYKTKYTNSQLSIQVIDDPSDKETFLVDDISIVKLPDRPPVVTSPPVVNSYVGFAVQFTVTASDPDGHTITSFTHTGAPGSTFSTNSSKTSGTFAWTPAAVGNYDVVFSATANALTGRDTTRINVGPAPPNLVRNPTFETDTSYWGPYGNAKLTRSAFGQGHLSNYALQIKGSGSSSFGCDDVPNSVTGAIKNSVYRITAYVRSLTHTGGKSRIRLYELKGSQQGSTYNSPEMSLSSTWKQLILTHTVRTNGCSLSVRITDEKGGQTFLVDNVSIQLISLPAIVAVPVEVEAVEQFGDEETAGPVVDTSADPAEETLEPDTRRAFPDALASFGTEGEAWGARFERLPHDMEAEIPTVVLKYGGREITALPDRTLLGEDKDENGREEMVAWFDAAALKSLFADLPAGTQPVELLLEARTSYGRVASATVQLEAQGVPLVYAASFAPNPARGVGMLSFTLTRPGWVRVGLFDASGRRVHTLVDEVSAVPGKHSIRLDGGGRRRLAAGLYFYRVESGEGVLGGRFVFMK